MVKDLIEQELVRRINSHGALRRLGLSKSSKMKQAVRQNELSEFLGWYRKHVRTDLGNS